MLARNSLLFLLARGVPGLVNLALLMIFTRLLDTEEFGVYTLVLTAANLAYVLGFSWIGQAVLRFLPMHSAQPTAVLAAAARGFAVAMIVTLVAAAAIGSAGSGYEPALLILGVLLVWTRGWFEVNLEVLSARFMPGRYAVLSGTRALVALSLGTALVLQGYSVTGALAGLVVAFGLAGVGGTWRDWRDVIGVKVPRGLTRTLTGYALPLSLTAALGLAVSTTDRFLLAYFIDEAAAGVYAAAFDLTLFGLGMLFMAMHLSAYPLATSALEQNGPAAARAQLRRNAAFLIAVGWPAATTTAALGGNLAHTLLGPSFREMGAVLIPWIALVAALAFPRGYYFDLAFQLGRHTLRQTGLMMLTILVNVLLNLELIPRFGPMGSAYAAVASFTVALILSAWLGRHSFALPFPWRDAARVLLVCAAMASLLAMIADWRGPLALLVQLGAAAWVWCAGTWLLDIGGSRHALNRVAAAARARIAKRRAPRA